MDFVNELSSIVKEALLNSSNALILYKQFETSETMKQIIFVSPFFDPLVENDVKKQFLIRNNMILLSIRYNILEQILNDVDSDSISKFKLKYQHFLMEFDRIKYSLT